jgi:hypothetical protein
MGAVEERNSKATPQSGQGRIPFEWSFENTSPIPAAVHQKQRLPVEAYEKKG